MTDLPEPLTPSDCDVRSAPLPMALFVQMAVQQFGISASEAEAMVREIAARDGLAVQEIGHG